MKPLVSVIVPVYNVEKYLARCLDSIVGQTYQNLEIILVNDGSTDRSGEICCQYVRNDSRIHLFTQENKGQSAARNFGLDHMNGQYIVFVDSDDYISPYLVEILLEKLLEYGVPIAVCNYLEVEDGDDNAALDTIPMDLNGLCKKMSRDEVYDTIGTDQNGYFLVAHCKMYEKRIFKTLRYPAGMVYEDWITFPKVYIQIKEVCYMDLHLYAYRQSLNSTTRQGGTHYVHIEDRITAHLELYAFFQQYGIRKYSLITKKMLTYLAYEIVGFAGTEKAKQYIKEIEEKTYSITGEKLFSFKLMLFKVSPKLYWVTRKYYLKAKQLLHFLLRK